jgi:hypothetical protein
VLAVFIDLQFQDIAADLNTFTSDFISAVAAALGVPATEVAVVSVQPGSVVVEWTANAESEEEAEALRNTAQTTNVLEALEAEYGE